MAKNKIDKKLYETLKEMLTVHHEGGSITEPLYDEIKDVHDAIYNHYKVKKCTIPNISNKKELLKGNYRQSFLDWKSKYFTYAPKTYDYKEKDSKEIYTLIDLQKRYERAMLESPFIVDK